MLSSTDIEGLILTHLHEVKEAVSVVLQVHVGEAEGDSFTQGLPEDIHTLPAVSIAVGPVRWDDDALTVRVGAPTARIRWKEWAKGHKHLVWGGRGVGTPDTISVKNSTFGTSVFSAKGLKTPLLWMQHSCSGCCYFKGLSGKLHREVGRVDIALWEWLLMLVYGMPIILDNIVFFK